MYYHVTTYWVRPLIMPAQKSKSEREYQYPRDNNWTNITHTKMAQKENIFLVTIVDVPPIVGQDSDSLLNLSG